jgi:predicted nucleotidyltransferase
MPHEKLGQKDIEDVLRELKDRLKKIYGRRLLSVILYGSYARTEAHEGSDIDVAVVLDGEVMPGKEIDFMLDVITGLNAEYNALISVLPVSAKDKRMVKSPLLMNLQREGISL